MKLTRREFSVSLKILVVPTPPDAYHAAIWTNGVQVLVVIDGFLFYTVTLNKGETYRYHG